MAEMEKEGRPPENKRSRKPAHPVKREINAEMKVGCARAHSLTGAHEGLSFLDALSAPPLRPRTEYRELIHSSAVCLGLIC